MSDFDIASTQYEGLRRYLASYFIAQKQQTMPSRAAAREKLSRLSKPQFFELSTDVYDEMNRRSRNIPVPFLSVNDAFHPKRNQARQKLATLPTQRFKDLSSDIYFEIERRFPQVSEIYKRKYADGTFPAMEETAPVQKGLPKMKKSNSDILINNINGLDNLMTDLGSMKFDNSNEPDYSSNQKDNFSKKTAETNQYNKPSYAETNQYSRPSDGVQTMSANNSESDLLRTKELESQKSTIIQLHQSKAADSKKIIDLETKISSLKSQIIVLQEENEDVVQYRQQIQSLEQDNSSLMISLETLKKSNEELKIDYSILQEDYSNQEKKLEALQQENSSLNEEKKALEIKQYELADSEEEYKSQVDKRNITIEELNSQLEDHKAEIDQHKAASDQLDLTIQSLNKEIETLQQSNQNLKRQLETLQSNTTNSESPATIIASRHSGASSYLKKSQEITPISKNKIEAYEKAIDDILKSTRSDNPTTILVAMKSIVLACKNISEEAEAYEKANPELFSPSDEEYLDDAKNNISTSLTSLMNSTRTFASNFGKIPTSTIEAPIANLNDIIYDLLGLLVRVSVNDGAPNESEGMDIDELKNHLEVQTDLIVQGIQNLLSAMRLSNNFGQEFVDIVNGITVIVTDIVSLSHHSFERSENAQYLEEGAPILAELSKSSQTLKELGVSIMSSPNDKSLKQKIAASSYSIAKVNL